MTYSCRKYSGPRGQPHAYAVQDGYDSLRVGKIWVRVPHMVEHTHESLPIRCGYLERATDKGCDGCHNRGEG